MFISSSYEVNLNLRNIFKLFSNTIQYEINVMIDLYLQVKSMEF